MDKLTAGHGHRKGEVSASGSTKIERNYIDFIVSGQSLKQRCGLADQDLIGALGWMGNAIYAQEQINEFLCLIKTELPTGRTPLYVCPQCGHIGCGAITAKIVETRDTIIWKDFGYENDYSEPDLASYTHVGPFEFDKAQYRKLFETLRKVAKGA